MTEQEPLTNDIHNRANRLLEWACAEKKPRGGSIRGRYCDNELPGLLALIEKNPEELISCLVREDNQFAIQSALDHLHDLIDFAHLEKWVANPRLYSGPVLAKMIMLHSDQYILHVSQAFIQAAAKEGLVAREKPAPTSTPKPAPRQKPKRRLKVDKEIKPVLAHLKHTDVFNGGAVRRAYWHLITSYASKHAVDKKTSFVGNMLTSREINVWQLPEGTITYLAGAWGRRAELSVGPELLRARILIDLGVNISRSRIYKKYLPSSCS